MDLKSILISVGMFYWSWLLGIWSFFIPKKYRMKKIEGEIVLITGAASGLGRIMAIRFAKLKARVVIWDVNEAGLKDTAKFVKRFGAQCYHYVCDISDRKLVYATADKVKADVGNVSILINNAGIVSGATLLDIPDEKIIKTMEVNAISNFWTVKSFLPEMMKANHGHVVTISSMAGLMGNHYLTDYSASKFASIGFHEALSIELQMGGYDGINKTLVCPWYIATGMFAGVSPGLMPFLEPEKVIDEIMMAILTNQDVLYVPRIVHLTMLLKQIIPSKTLFWLGEVLGATRSMSTFYGRKFDISNLKNDFNLAKLKKEKS